MTKPTSPSRRSVLTGLSAASGGLLLGSPLAHAAAAQTARASDDGPQRPQQPLPPLWKIEQATIITMDATIPDLKRGDILVRDGIIEQIAPHIDAPQATVIDGRERIVFPGFIDAHNHMWQTQMRGMFGQTKGTLFFPLTRELDGAFRPQDIALSARMSAFENAAAGITTAADFFDNNRSPAYAEAALTPIPIRKRLLYGNRSKTASDSIDLDDLARLHEGWNHRPDHTHMMLGMAWRLPRDLSDQDAMAMKQREYTFARDHGLPIQVHVSGPGHHAMFQTLIDHDYLFPGLQVIHATDAKPAHLAALIKAKASLALTPLTEHRVGFGLTRYSHFKDVPRTGLGIDGNGLAGAADMFAVMRLMAMTEIGATHDQTSVDTHHLFSMATIGAAESLGLDDHLGSLRPGKQADITMVDTRALNLGMVGDDPITLLIFCAKPENVEFVSVAGQAVKRDGQILGLDMEKMLAEVQESIDHIQQARTQAT